MKFCVNCKYYEKEFSSLYITEYCLHHSFEYSGVNLVTGKSYSGIHKTSCSTVRSRSGRCGPEAKLFEQKEIVIKEKKWWQIWK